MPLLDHFHPPLYPRRSWESFHSRWTNSIADQLNELLPRRYFAEVQLHLGSQVEADVAEVVSGRKGNLHNDLIRLMGLDPQIAMGDKAPLYAASYRPVRRDQANQIDVWPVVLSIGGSLPLLPLALRGGSSVPLDLEGSYEDARCRSRL
jgi:hypothetical protein